jgi:hypothetical protein
MRCIHLSRHHGLFAVNMLTWRWQTIDCLFSLGVMYIVQNEFFELRSLKRFQHGKGEAIPVTGRGGP